MAHWSSSGWVNRAGGSVHGECAQVQPGSRLDEWVDGRQLTGWNTHGVEWTWNVFAGAVLT